MKKILQITSSLERNGTETFIMNVLRNIDRDQFQFDFLLNRSSGNGFEKEAISLGAKIFTFPPRTKGWNKYISFLRKFFNEHKDEYAAVHFNGNSFTELMPVKIAKEAGIPVRIVHSHNSNTQGLHNKLLHKYNRKKIHKIATTFLACSSDAKKWGYSKSKVYERAVIIPNGIDLENFRFNQEARRQIRKELSIPEDILVVGHTGGFRAVKNQKFLLEIFEEIKKTEPKSILILCGKGETIEEIKGLVKEKGLEESVKFLGVRTDINKILSAIDLYIFPSFYEGLPFALIEAQASGVPVLASNVISPEIELSSKIKLKSLNESALSWAKDALSMIQNPRVNEISDKLYQYDIRRTCEILSSLYNNN